MGLMDVLHGMANGPHGPAEPGKRGGISPITMGLLALLAYKTMRGAAHRRVAPRCGQTDAAGPHSLGGRNVSLNGPSLVGSRRRRRSRGACVTEQRT